MIKVWVSLEGNQIVDLSGEFEFLTVPRIGETIQFTNPGDAFHDGCFADVRSVFHNLGQKRIEIFAESDYSSWFDTAEEKAQAEKDLKSIGFQAVRLYDPSRKS